MYYLEKVNIPEQAHKCSGQLSGGQQQRIVIARGLAMDPDAPYPGVNMCVIHDGIHSPS